MILVDTSVWIDHLHRSDALLAATLERDEVVTHAFVIEELALGSIRPRTAVLASLERLRRLPTARHQDVLALVSSGPLFSRGLGVVDAHLLAATLISPGARLWTRDKRLATAADERGVAHVPH